MGTPGLLFWAFELEDFFKTYSICINSILLLLHNHINVTYYFRCCVRGARHVDPHFKTHMIYTHASQWNKVDSKNE